MPLVKADGAIVERLHPAQDLEQRRFAGAVRADQPGAFFGRDQPVAPFEQKLVAEAFPHLQVESLPFKNRALNTVIEAHQLFLRHPRNAIRYRPHALLIVSASTTLSW